MKEEIRTKEVKVYVTSDGKEFSSKTKAEAYERKLATKVYTILLQFTGSYTMDVKATSMEEAVAKTKEELEYDVIDGYDVKVTSWTGAER